MLVPQECLPPFVRYANAVHRGESEAVVSRLTELRKWIKELEQRLAWELPMLQALEGGTALAHEVAQQLRSLEASLSGSYSDYESRLEQFLETLGEAQNLKDELPVFCDARIVNEMLILAGAHLEGRCDQTPLRVRLPVLADWIERLDTDWKTYLKLFPDQLYRVNKVLAQIELMRRGAGAVYLYLEGEESGGLHTGLRGILQILQSIEPAIETRFHTESERVEFSPDLRLERAWRGADWASWEQTSLTVSLLAFYQESLAEIERLKCRTLVPWTLKEEVDAALASAQESLLPAFDTLFKLQARQPDEEPHRPARAQALADLESARADLSAVQEEVQRHQQASESLRGYPLFRTFSTVLEGLLRETTPDAYLQQLVESIDEGREKFQERIEEMAEEEGVDEEALETVWDALQRKQSGLLELRHYLQEPTPALIYQAYEAVLEPFSVLSLFAVPEQIEEEATQTTCPFCGETVVLEGDRCPACKRLLELTETSRMLGDEESGVGSTLINDLDRRTAAGEEPEKLASDWRGLAQQLESMGRVARKAERETELVDSLVSLGRRCREVAEGLLAHSLVYSTVRGELLADFLELQNRLSEFGKNLE